MKLATRRTFAHTPLFLILYYLTWSRTIPILKMCGKIARSYHKRSANLGVFSGAARPIRQFFMDREDLLQPCKMQVLNLPVVPVLVCC